MINLTFHNATRKKYSRRSFQKTLALAAQLTGLGDREVGIAISLVSPQQIQKLNARYRQRDKPTDVLSFDLGKVSLDGIMELGDIFICPAAADTGLLELAAHGFLHLLGYDHVQPRARQTMLRLQQKILKHAQTNHLRD